MEKRRDNSETNKKMINVNPTMSGNHIKIKPTKIKKKIDIIRLPKCQGRPTQSRIENLK